MAKPYDLTEMLDRNTFCINKLPMREETLPQFAQLCSEREKILRAMDKNVDGDAFCIRCGLPMPQCLCKPRKL